MSVLHRAERRKWTYWFKVYFSAPYSRAAVICQFYIPVVFTIWFLSFLLDMPFTLARFTDIAYLYAMLVFVRQRDEMILIKEDINA